MVKKLIPLFCILFFLVLLFSFSQASEPSSPNKLVNELPTTDVGELIATKSGWNLIEFWHYSGGYWKATTKTENGIKEIIIKDRDVIDGAWDDISFLTNKIYENEFILEYKINHPREVLNAIDEGATITPVMSINTETLKYSDYVTIPTNYFNYEPLPPGLPESLPETPEYSFHDEHILVRALPKLNCLRNTNLQKVVQFPYPHRIPLVQTGFGSLAYAMYHHDGSVTGESYSPDPYYGDRYTIQYNMIKDISGNLKPGFLVTTSENPQRKDEASESLRIGYGTFANAGAVSIRFWYPIKIDYYALFPDTHSETPAPTPEPTPTLPAQPSPSPISQSEDLTPANSSSMNEESVCKIRADNRDNEQFDVSDGIPVRENLYVNVQAKEYLYESTFNEHTHYESKTIYAKKTWNLTWKEDHGHYETSSCGSGTFYHVKGRYCKDSDGDGIKDCCPGHSYKGCRDTNGDGINDSCPGHSNWVSNWVDKSQTQVVYSNPSTVTRSYSYWTVDHFEAFVADNATVENTALPGGSVNITQQGLSAPQITLSHSNSVNNHVLNDPFADAISSSAITYDSDIGAYVVELSSGNIDGGTSKPSVPAISGEESILEDAIPQYKTQNDLLIFNGITIMDNSISNNGDTQNPTTIPDSDICDRNTFYLNNLTIPDTVLNQVHTSSGTIRYKRLSQTINPVHDATLQIPIASINDVTVHTPVVCNSGVLDDKNNDQTLNPDRSRSALVLGRPSRIRFLTTGEHLNIKGYNVSGSMDCRKYTKSRQVRFPFDAYIGTDKPDNSYFVPGNSWCSIPMEPSFDEFHIYIPTWVKEGDYEIEFREIAANAPNLNNTEHLANLDINNYVAVRSSPVRVIGRVYGFKITDISDQLWQEVFRVSKNSATHTGNYYFVGTKDEEGNSRGIPPLFTLPILEGSHAVYKNRGALKTGYTFRFDVTTVGDYYNNNDYLVIEPKFYYVKKDGTRRQEVDLYYHEEFGGKENYFVKIEPLAKNRDNTKSMKLGNAYRNVPDSDISYAAGVLGMDENAFRNTQREIGWLDKIILSKYQRTFVGDVKSLPDTVNTDNAKKSVQKWYVEYYVPNDMYVTPSGFDVSEYGRTHNGLDGNENFWLKEGYIIINFNIETVKEGDFSDPSNPNTPVLSYWASPNCNMFEREGFTYSKTDYHGSTFQLIDGDIIFYDTDKRSSDDYRSGGTH
jgi:hypothetical protein